MSGSIAPTVWMVDDFMVIHVLLSLLEKCFFSINMFHVFTLFHSLSTKSEAKSNKNIWMLSKKV